MLCQFGELRNGSVATHFSHFSCTATSSATSEYVAVREQIGQDEELVDRNEERIKNKPSFPSKIYLNDSE